jgi:two-component system alkaline phosphatase synthesis response regulator PhoP
MATVLVVEDDRDIRDVLRRYLERAGYAVLSTGSGAEALGMIDAGGADLVLLDLGLPDIDGLEVLRAVHDRTQTPVLVLTARSELDDRIKGLSLGADDYVTKPFSPTEVVLRVGAILSRTQGSAADPDRDSYGDGRLVLDHSMRRAVVGDRELDLTATEWGVLVTLASVPGRPFSRYELVNRVRGYEFSGYERSIDSHVKNLRHKLGEDAPIVETVVGVGYRLGLRRDP